MHRFRFIGLAILSIQLGLQGLMAQTDPCAHRTVPVRVSSSDNKVLTGLTADKFQATVRHLPIKILSVTPNDKPVRVFLVLDASGSMTKNAKSWQAFIAVAEEALDQLPASTPVGLMVFSDYVEKIGALGINRTLVREQFEQLRSGHRVAATALWDTLRAAALQFDQPLPGDSIYAITDGEDNASGTSRSLLEEILLGRGVRLFTFSIESKDGLTQKQWEKGGTNSLVKATGGHSVLIPESRAGSFSQIGKGAMNPSNDLTQLSEQLQMISTFARVELELPKPLHKLEDWDLKTVGITGRDVVVEFPHKLASCLAE